MSSRALILVGIGFFVWLGCIVGLGGCGGCGGDDDATDAARIIDAAAPGTVSIMWTLTDQNGQPVTCDQLGATTVFIVLQGRSAGSGINVSLSCTLTPGTSQPVPPDTYDVSYELHAGETVLATGQDQRSVVIGPGTNTVLTPVTFKVQATGGLALSLAALGKTSNCKTAAMGGAGITAMTITLVQASGGCEPLSFAITRGGSSVGSYQVNCSSPVVSACIETDETLTATTVPSGPYTVHVIGKVNAAACWANDDSLRVPPLGATQPRTLNLALQSATPGCN